MFSTRAVEQNLVTEPSARRIVAASQRRSYPLLEVYRGGGHFVPARSVFTRTSGVADGDSLMTLQARTEACLFESTLLHVLLIVVVRTAIPPSMVHVMSKPYEGAAEGSWPLQFKTGSLHNVNKL
jgi:hypothetical protein